MARKTKRLPQFLAEDPEPALREIVDVLNRGNEANDWLDPAAHARLLRVVRAWKKSGPNLQEMKNIAGDDYIPLAEVERVWKTHLASTGTGRAYWHPSATGPKSRDMVVNYYGRLILNPLCDRLGGPCPNCAAWYVKKTRRESVFCSRRCAGNATKARVRARDHERKLQRARSATRNWSTTLRFATMDWKDYVSQAAGVSKKWLTRAVNAGELRPPPK